jgi:uncharacterized protein (TIGR02246 family)
VIRLGPPTAFLLFCAAAGGGCGGRAVGPAASPQSLLQTDRDFAAAVADAAPAERAAVWASWFAADGRQLIPGRVVEGREAVAALMAPVFADTAYTLHWEPDHAEIGGGGDLGWTTGRYRSRAGGDSRARTGRYLTIWRRTPDGAWRVALDTGTPDP